MSEEQDIQGRKTFLRINSPSFNLELEGNANFILQSYDLIRGDIFKRLKVLMDQEKGVREADVMSATPTEEEVPSPAVQHSSEGTPPTRATAARRGRLSPTLGEPGASRAQMARSGAVQRLNIRDVKARMASKVRPKVEASDPVVKKKVTLVTAANLSGPSEEVQRRIKEKEDSSQALPAPPFKVRELKERHVWVYITHEAYNKVYALGAEVCVASPLGHFLDFRGIKKIHLDGVSLPAFEALQGKGQTMWSELTPDARKKLAIKNKGSKSRV